MYGDRVSSDMVFGAYVSGWDHLIRLPVSAFVCCCLVDPTLVRLTIKLTIPSSFTSSPLSSHPSSPFITILLQLSHCTSFQTQTLSRYLVRLFCLLTVSLFSTEPR